ncbi:MAG TPA: zf-HC2 domain-containing protein [Syntrophomonadaceae bacterium]|nr:zf-HC2 domain-containing protein [Syntrophomonadaceae bacterium]
MNCQLVNKHILDYCDNKLSPETKQLIEEHILDCATCKSAIDLCKAENAVLYNLPILEPATDFTGKVMEVIESDITLNTYNSGKSKKYYNRYLLALLPIAILVVFLITTNLPDNFKQNIISSQAENSENLITNSPPLAEKQKITVPEITDKEEINHKMATSSDVLYDNQVKNDPRVKQDNSNRSEELEKSKEENFNHFNLTLQNVPDKFLLQEVIKNQDDTITYSYVDTLNENTLDISITKVIADELPTNFEIASQELRILAANDPPNRLSKELEFNENSYIVTFESNLSEEEIVKLWSLITITN